MPNKVSILTAGHCTHPHFMVKKGGGLNNLAFPATVALIEHPKHGRILFDTGYSQRFFEATRRWPEKIYALITPVHLGPEETAACQLEKRGIGAGDINHVILSHFHADHVSGMSDFPNARYIFLPQAYNKLAGLSRLGQIRRGFLQALLPDDFHKRAEPVDVARTINSPLPLLPLAYPLFPGDDSLLAIPLPGHAPGHMGLYVESTTGPLFFVADACWIAEQFQELSKPNPLAYLIMDDAKIYEQTVAKLHDLRETCGGLKILPCHCQSTWHKERLLS